MLRRGLVQGRADSTLTLTLTLILILAHGPHVVLSGFRTAFQRPKAPSVNTLRISLYDSSSG